MPPYDRFPRMGDRVLKSSSPTVFLRKATEKPSASPIARSNRADHLLGGTTFVRTKPSIARVEGVTCPNADFGFTLETFLERHKAAASRNVQSAVPRARSPGAYFCSVHFPDLVNPTQHCCKFRLRPR